MISSSSLQTPTPAFTRTFSKEGEPGCLVCSFDCNLLPPTHPDYANPHAWLHTKQTENGEVVCKHPLAIQVFPDALASPPVCNNFPALDIE